MTRPGARTYTGTVRRALLRGLTPVVSAVVLAAVAVGHVPGGRAQSDPDGPSLHTLVASADVIVIGRIVRTTYVERPNDLGDISYNNAARYTAVIGTIQVEETLKGTTGTTLKLNYPKRPRVSGEPVYDPDQDGVWLLRKSERRDEYLADEIGRFQPRENKEHIKAILAASRSMKRPAE